MLKFAILCIMIYFIVMWAFMMGNTLTGYSIPWLDETADKLSNIGIGILILFLIFFVSACVYGIVAKDPNFVGVIK